MKVYVLTSGIMSYADYHIAGVVDTREKAEIISDMFGYSISTYDTDEFDGVMCRKGNKLYTVTLVGSRVDSVAGFDHMYDLPPTIPEDMLNYDEVTDEYVVECFAPNEDEARRTALAMREEFLNG